jgi:hypothetical protein
MLDRMQNIVGTWGGPYQFTSPGTMILSGAFYAATQSTVTAAAYTGSTSFALGLDASRVARTGNETAGVSEAVFVTISY